MLKSILKSNACTNNQTEDAANCYLCDTINKIHKDYDISLLKNVNKWNI